MTAIVLTDLTEAKLDGAGVFDRLMVAAKAHLDAEFKKGAIKGPEYAQVYLGQVQSILSTALQFVVASHKSDLEAQLLEQQVLLAQKQVEQADAQIALINKQVLQVQAQTELVQQQKANALLDAANIPKQGQHLDAQTALVNQQKENAVQEKLNLVAQECLLKSQFDNTVATTLRVGKETDLMAQKIVTEKAQTTSLGVDADSVVGRQKGLYLAQTKGFDRDAEQKAASTLLQTWSTQRMTDDGVSANADNMLNDASLGRVVNKLLQGINA